MKKPLLFISLFFALSAAAVAQGAFAQFSMDIPEQCDPGQIIVYNNSDTSGITGIAQWQWNIGGMIYTDYEPVVPTLTAGEYQIRLTLIDDGGPVDTYIQPLTIYPDLNSFSISTGATACPGEKINFWYPDEITAFSVDWDFGDGSFKDFTNYQNYPDHIYYQSGSYDVTLTIEPGTIIKFKRIDLPNAPLIAAHFNQVVDTSLATVIGTEGCIVSTS